MATTINTRKVRITDVDVARDLLTQNSDLPWPTSVVIDHEHLTLTVDSAYAVEQWAEVMAVDADHEQHADGTWTDRVTGQIIVTGQITVFGQFSNGRQSEDVVDVTVYRPGIAHGELVL